MEPGWRCLAQRDAGSPLPSAVEIDARMRSRSRGFGSMTARVHMRVLTRDGGTGTREIRMWMREYPDQGTAALCVVESPADLRETALLSRHHPGAADRQWLYLPAAQRVRRLAGGSRGGAFLGSDFTYADLAGGRIEGTVPAFVGTGKVDEVDCYLLAYETAGGEAVYGRQTVWVDPTHFVVRRIDYDDVRGRPLKTLWMAYGSGGAALRYGHARHLRMESHRSGGQTLVEWLEVSYGVALDERLFDPRMLPDARFR